MKTVRLSESLKRDIVKQAIEKFDKANPDQVYPSDGAKLLTKYGVTDKVQETITSFKQIWGRDIPMEDVERVHVRSTATVMDEVWDDEQDGYVEKPKEDTRSYTLDIPTTPIPSFMSEYRDFYLDVPPEDKTFIACYQVEVANDNLNKKRREYRNNLESTLEKFHTLNQLMKAAPYMKDLVPDDRLQKMYEKDERGERVKEQAEMAENELKDLREVLLEDKLLGDDV